VVLLVVWFFWVLFSGDSSLIQLWKLKRETTVLQAEIDRVKARLEEIDGEAKKLDDPEYLETLARERYGMVREGEKCYRLVPIEE
jgi:cell division protein DivIC